MAVDPAVVRATQEQLRKDGHDGIASVIELLRWTACRPSEVCTITAGDLYETYEGLEIRLGTHKTKKHTGTERVIPLNDRAAEIVQRALLDDEVQTQTACSSPPQPRSQSHPMVSIKPSEEQPVRRAFRTGPPINSVTSGATEMLDAGCSEAEASAMMGHTPGSTVVRRYSKDRVRLARRASKGNSERSCMSDLRIPIPMIDGYAMDQHGEVVSFDQQARACPHDGGGRKGLEPRVDGQMGQAVFPARCGHAAR